MKYLRAIMTTRLPLAVLAKEGKSEDDVRKEFAELQHELADHSPEGVRITLVVDIVEEPE